MPQPTAPGPRLAALTVTLAASLALGACGATKTATGTGTVAGASAGGGGPSAGGQATAARTDPDMARVIKSLADLGSQPVELLSTEKARSQPSFADAYRRVLQEQGATMPGAAIRTTNLTVPGPGGAIPARLYTPPGAPRSGAPLIVYWHGGGWVIADLDTYDATPRALAARTGAAVLSLHYRQGPENRFPAAYDDALAGYRWAVSQARRLGADPARIAVAGESAGGSLALATAVAARDAGLPQPVHMALVYPVATTDTNTPSKQENASAVPLSSAGVQWFVTRFTNGSSDLADPRLDPVRRGALQGLPSATIVNAEVDPLRSEGEALAGKLRKAGVPVEQRTYPGVTHEFFGMAPVVADAVAAQTLMADRLREALGRPARVASR
ncbi:alpha/beta hydrolase [Belnapia sp. T18]|uniref:Alpha/beta hydrolase n=1 Tax=Belnapia arida TaxID=2804533 RepID=A0ABS1TXF2_9PROT|nr:alpha/beta hydrolase [Belnapia arida]MBL6077118.1 alpha/beta hydrolase [Belnapia arida]